MKIGSLGDGAVFFASSAGGAYAGSTHPPFDEHSPPSALSPYGRSKLEQEALVRECCDDHRIPGLIGRIANLFGPGQNLSKPQGLISQLCWNQIHHRPLEIYVSLDTIRDYLFAPDCGRMVAAGLDLVSQRTALQGSCTTTKVMASQRPMSIGGVIGEFRRLSKQTVRMSTRASPLSRYQVRDLRLRSSVLPELDKMATTSFPVGLHVTYEDLRRRAAVARSRP